MSLPTVHMPGSLKSAERMKTCSKCERKRAPEGGIQMSPNKWRCAECWRGFALRK